MLPPNTVGVKAFAVATETVLREISLLRPDLDLVPIRRWGDAQALASRGSGAGLREHDLLHFVDVAYRAGVRGEPWQVSSECRTDCPPATSIERNLPKCL